MTLDEIKRAKEWIEGMNRAHSPFVPGNIIPVYETLLKLCDQAIMRRADGKVCNGDKSQSA